ncbi:hypothetical protein SLEP1_g56097 [Rubroshorea leprosula]|uniref:Uncharacterized protein n=1 Tax=Rubroshorea leprosula TaxID=152421 RepID=A0AAV5MHC2_9ROSI|nr:hypothetical protein SLEP1_g56097 [Rubroshorea leprosula]
MLCLSDSEENKVNEFQEIVEAVGVEEVEGLRRFSGRVFRSPTLFEDMSLNNHPWHGFILPLESIWWLMAFKMDNKGNSDE